MDWLIAGRFRVLHKIGSGTYGEIYLGFDNETSREVALKFERAPSPRPQLHIESQAYARLAEGVGIPTVSWIGLERGFTILVIEKLGQSLEDLLVLRRRPFSLKTTLMIADQCLERIEFIHRRFLVHRDIKPTNMLIGTARNLSVVYFIDFGLSKYYRDRETLVHIPMTRSKNFVGTARYVSANVMNGFEPSRRDDLIALGYVWVYLFKGALPWQSLELAEGEDRLAAIAECKQSLPFDELCSGMPPEFLLFFETVSRLQFEDEPPYAELRMQFRERFMASNFSYDGNWDWMAGANAEAGMRPTRLSLTATPLLNPKQHKSTTGVVPRLKRCTPSVAPETEDPTATRGSKPPLIPGARRTLGPRSPNVICVPAVGRTGLLLAGGRRRSLDLSPASSDNILRVSDPSPD
jgi:serine/threonine protein kinase